VADLAFEQNHCNSILEVMSCEWNVHMSILYLLNVTFPDRIQYCFENVCTVSVYGCLNTIDHIFYFHFASPGRDQLKYLEIIKYKTNENKTNENINKSSAIWQQSATAAFFNLFLVCSVDSSKIPTLQSKNPYIQTPKAE